MPTLIPYAPGRDAITRRIVNTLNALQTFIAVTPAEITAMNALRNRYTALLQAQKSVPNTPGGFVPWKLGSPAPSSPALSPAICFFGTVTQSGSGAPVITETTTSGLILAKARTSTGFYTVTGFPTGYAIHAAVASPDGRHAITVSVTGQTVTIKTYVDAGIADDLLSANAIQFILMPI